METNKKPTVTVTELKHSYISLPESLFTRRLTANEFGAAVLHQLKTKGLDDGPVRMLGYAFFAGLSPVEIAVYAYLCFNCQADVKEIVKARKLTERIVKRSIEQLGELGLIVKNAEKGSYESLTLTDLFGEDQTAPPAADAAETDVVPPSPDAVPKS